MQTAYERQQRPTVNRRSALAFLVTAVALVAAALLVLSDGDAGDDVVWPPTTTTTAATTTTATVTTTTAPEVVDPTVVWPAPGTTTRFATPEDAARSFATALLGFDAPVIGAFRPGDNRSGEVPVQPTGNGPETTVLVRQAGAGDDWSVLGAVTANIEVATPTAMAAVRSPLRLTGRALAFEGNVQVEVRADDGAVLGAGFVTGGGDVLRPFDDAVVFETPPSPYGTVVFFTVSMHDGRVWEAATVRVVFADPTDADAAACAGYRPPRPRPTPGQMEVKVYFWCDAEDGALRAAHRVVDESPRVLTAALGALLAGPTADERAASLGSWFSDDTAGKLRSVTVDVDGHAVVDLADLRTVIPNASTSAGSVRLLAQLDATVFQFRTIESVEYRIDGSCEAFTEWLQYGGCDRRTRPAAP